ncbi:MAG: hypothetical protein OXF84_08650 [Bacteroidetes bacterium]|nr:hypothetical protein [Bacteroidota bacterium]
MPEKERARLKEQYVKELRERKRVQQTLGSVHARRSVNQALGNMADMLDDLTDGSIDEITTRMDAETALNEARLEIALEEQHHQEQHSSPPIEKSTEPPSEPSRPPSKTFGPRLRTDRLPNSEDP